MAVDENPSDREALQYLVDYLRIDTSNPPGSETAAAEFFKRIFDGEGIESQLVGDNLARRSIYARLRSGSAEPALLLLHHLDVVPAKASEWSVPPFSGQQSGGYVWGRGALDIKSLGIANLMAVLDLHRSKTALKRDVIFLGVADEEAGGLLGARNLLEKHPELFVGVGYVLNEGGANETIVDFVSYWGIEVSQKIPLWLRITARSPAGHGAVPPEDGGSIAHLVDVLQDIRKIPMPYRLTPSVERYFKTLSRAKLGKKRDILSDPSHFLSSPDFEKQLPNSYRALLRGTLALTQLEAGSSTNAIPPTAVATCDIRLLPGDDPGPLLDQIRAVAGDRATIDVLLRGEPTPDSPIDTDLYRTLSSVMRESEPKSLVGPMVTAGTTDSRFFRARGIVAYGISPFKVNYYDGDTVHGPDERIRTTFFTQGVGLMRQVVRRFCAEP